MRRIKWRKVCPVVQSAAYVLLVWHGCWYRPTWQFWFQNWMSHSPASTGWYPVWIDGIESFSEQFAAGLNFPVAFLSALTLVPFEDQLRTGASRELALHIVTAMYIPLLWYMVGKHLDTRKQVKAVQRSKTRKALAASSLAALTLIGVFMLAGLKMGERYTMVALSLVWIGSGIMVAWSRLRNSRSEVPER
jgi:hypothetical protein